MNQTFIQDVLNEINRIRSDKGLEALKIDTDSPEYAASVKAYAADLALQKAGTEASFPHVWTMVSTTSGTQAAKLLMASSSAALNPNDAQRSNFQKKGVTMQKTVYNGDCVV